MRHEVIQLSEGWTGTDETVAKARDLVEQGLTDPRVVLQAQNLVRQLPERDTDAEIEAISNFVRGKIRYTNEGVETLKHPALMLAEIRKYGKAVGDCDDHVILWLTLLRAVGRKVRVSVISQRRDRQANHIYGEVYSKTRGWITDDTIVKNRPLGWSPLNSRTTKVKRYEMGDLEIGGDMSDPFALTVATRRDELRTARQNLTEARRARFSARRAERAARRDKRQSANEDFRARRRAWMESRPRRSQVSGSAYGGAEQYDSNSEWAPMATDVFNAPNLVAASYRTKRGGGALAVGDDGSLEGVGILPALAPLASGLLAKLGKRKKKKAASAAPPPPAPEAKGGIMKNPVALVGGAAVILGLLFAITRR